MWGMTKEGIAQRKIAATRLADHSLGRAVPEIVGISSSADAHHAYCANHRDEGVCTSGFGGLRP
jgi:hypothetical protein